MNPRTLEALFLALLIVPGAFVIAGTDVDMLLLSLGLFAFYVLVFFWPTLWDRRKQKNRSEQD